MDAPITFARHISARSSAGQLGNDTLVRQLVTRARGGDQRAWDALVERFAPLIWSVCSKYRLSRDDADDVAQSVWMGLVHHLDNVRDPAALPGWLATTARRECGRVARRMHAPDAVTYEFDTETIPDERARTVEEELLAAERQAALREAFACLPLRGQRLIGMLSASPQVSYAEISATLGIPVGSIGPTRGRYLDRIRRHPAVAALISPEPGSLPSALPKAS
jgi:RNA polymerase sigma factor (sigma-70 family)